MLNIAYGIWGCYITYPQHWENSHTTRRISQGSLNFVCHVVLISRTSACLFIGTVLVKKKSTHTINKTIFFLNFSLYHFALPYLRLFGIVEKFIVKWHIIFLSVWLFEIDDHNWKLLTNALTNITINIPACTIKEKKNFQFQRQNVIYNLVHVFQHIANFLYHLYRNLGTLSILTIIRQPLKKHNNQTRQNHVKFLYPHIHFNNCSLYIYLFIVWLISYKSFYILKKRHKINGTWLHMVGGRTS